MSFACRCEILMSNLPVDLSIRGTSKRVCYYRLCFFVPRVGCFGLLKLEMHYTQTIYLNDVALTRARFNPIV